MVKGASRNLMLVFHLLKSTSPCIVLHIPEGGKGRIMYMSIALTCFFFYFFGLHNGKVDGRSFILWRYMCAPMSPCVSLCHHLWVHATRPCYQCQCCCQGTRAKTTPDLTDCSPPLSWTHPSKGPMPESFCLCSACILLVFFSHWNKEQLVTVCSQKKIRPMAELLLGMLDMNCLQWGQHRQRKRWLLPNRRGKFRSCLCEAVSTLGDNHTVACFCSWFRIVCLDTKAQQHIRQKWPWRAWFSHWYIPIFSHLWDHFSDQKVPGVKWLIWVNWKPQKPGIKQMCRTDGGPRTVSYLIISDHGWFTMWSVFPLAKMHTAFPSMLSVQLRHGDKRRPSGLSFHEVLH